MKKKRGLTYAEALIATAVFGAVALGALSLSAAAAKNREAASELARLSMAANYVALALRDMILDGNPPDGESVRALAAARGAGNYRARILSPCGAHMFGSPFYSSAESAGDGFAAYGTVHGGGYALVYVELLNEFFATGGRALQFAIDLEGASAFWRKSGG